MADKDNDGAFPSPGGDGKAAVLGVPKGRMKAKTNVTKLIIVAIAVSGLLLATAGLLVVQKYRQRMAQTEPAAQIGGHAVPSFASKNEAVADQSIESRKSTLRQQELREADAKKRAEEEARAAQERERAAALARLTAQQSAAAQAAPAGLPGTYEAPAPSTPHERKLSGAVVMSLPGQGGRGVAATVPAANSSGAGLAGAAGSMASRLSPTVLPARAAGKLTNLTYLLKKGSSIPCALQTGIDTTLPGFITCSVLTDIYSANGKTLLIERGSTVFGEQQSALQHGQARTFVLWNRIDTPKGVYINVDSPAADQQGYSGIPGLVDSHFAQRFGGAIVLSVISDFSQALATRASGSGSAAVVGGSPYSNTIQASQDMAAEALRNTINIPPTLRVKPGTVVTVSLGRDLDFADVYAVVE